MTRCTVCSELTNEPLAVFEVTWRDAGPETQVLCDRADCWGSLAEQWSDWMRENRTPPNPRGERR